MTKCGEVHGSHEGDGGAQRDTRRAPRGSNEHSIAELIVFYCVVTAQVQLSGDIVCVSTCAFVTTRLLLVDVVQVTG